MHSFDQLNRKLAAKITSIVGTMECAYLFAALALISLPTAASTGVAALVAWTAQTFLQLVLLPLIMVGSDVLNERIEARSKADHETLLEELRLLQGIHLMLVDKVAKSMVVTPDCY